MRRRIAWLLVLPLLAVLTWSVARRGRYTVPFSTWSTSAEGAKALFTFLEETGRSPARWTQDLGRLPAGGVLVAMGDGTPERRLARRERDVLARWIDAGGTLVVLGVQRYVPRGISVALVAPEPGESAKPAGGSPIDFSDFGDATERDEDERPKPETVAVGDHPAMRGLGAVSLRRPADVKVDEPGFELLLGDLKSPRGIVLAHGRGHVVAIGSASFVTNSDLGEGDHAPFFARLVDRYRRGGRVFFDEYHLGMGRGRSVVSYLRARGLGPPLVQFLLVVALLLLRASTRFGAPAAPLPPPPDDMATYVEGMGRIYARADDVAASMERIAKDALARIAARHGLPPPAGGAALAESLRRSGRATAAEAVDAIEARHAAALRGRPGRTALVGFTRDVDALAMRASENRRTS